MESVEALDHVQEIEQTPQPASDAGFSLPENEDAELEAVWDSAQDDASDEQVDTGRDELGRFKGKSEEGEEVETPSPVEGEGEATDADADPSTPESVDVPLPSNWQGMDEAWKKIPAEIRHDIAERENRVHKTLSEQGRQIAAVRPIADVVERHADQFRNVRLQDGSTPTADQAVEYLFTMNNQMNTKPVETILQFADTFGVREQVAARLGVQGNPSQGGNESVLLEKIAGLEQIIRSSQDPARIDQRITEKLNEERQEKEAAEYVSRLSKDKPLYTEIPQEDFLYFISKARAATGDDASAEVVFDAAYDMAVHANPTLRAKLAAAIPAAIPDPKKVEDAKRANGVNVTSTSSGKTRKLTEEEELGAVYDKSNRK